MIINVSVITRYQLKQRGGVTLKKNKTKSLLACAVLAGVLTGGMLPVQAANVNAVVGPKDFGSLIGKNIAFGQKRGYVQSQTVSYPDGTPTWQIVAWDSGGLSLLANERWGYNRFSTYAGESQICYYSEALEYLNENVSQFFSVDELRLLQNQTSIVGHVDGWGFWRYDVYGIFALPTLAHVDGLANRGRAPYSYWLGDGFYRESVRGDVWYIQSFIVNVVQPDGSIVQQRGEDAKDIFPTINLKPSGFAYYKDKVLSDTFKEEVSDTSTIKFTLKDTVKEKNINITKLNVTQDKITFDVAGLATGAGQGIGGLVEDADGNYLAYARLADSTNGMAENVKIKFDSSITGNNTIHLFNEWIGTSYDLLGNYYEMYVKTENAKISAFTNKWDVTYDELTIGKGVNYTAEGSSNVTVKNKFVWENSNGVKLIDTTITEGGRFHLGGAFSVVNPDDATVTNRTLKLTKTADVWNDIELYGINGGVMAMNVDLNSLYMDGGTFTIQGILKAADYLQLRDGAELTIGGTLEAKRLEVNGALNLVDGAVTDETHLCNDSTLKLTGSNKILNLQESLTTDDGAKITGIDSTDKVVIDENLTAKGNITLENVTLEVGENIQVQGNLNGDAVISANKMDVKGNIYANSLTVKGVLNLANGNAQSGSIGTLTFGESGKTAVYAFDLGKDTFTINTSASGEIRLATKYASDLGSTVDVFTTTGGSLSGLTIQDARVTDMANKQTFIFTQNATNKGKLDVTLSQHNAAVNFADIGIGQKIVFGNYWQDNSNAKQPVVWTYVKEDNGEPVFLSDKVIAATDGSVGNTEMWKITNMLKMDSTFVKDLFTAGEFAMLNVLNKYGDVLGLPSFDDVKDGGNYGWNVNDRKAQTTSYAGDNARYYALGSIHWHSWETEVYGFRYTTGANVNDWVDFNGIIRNSGASVGVYGIRPTISFDTSSVLFATNAEGGKGSVAEGQITRLKDVESSSTLELTLDDVYLAQTKGTARMTGDVALDNIALDGGSVSVDYSNAKFVDSNSFVSVLVGEGNLAQDYFGYGKTK
ncbi:MAG: hypothetical protein KBS60_01440, partial [Phascolarctobacterium sp.]|nr:hypothetical protein [Candidatus Phascolarctobacterium caballi]